MLSPWKSGQTLGKHLPSTLGISVPGGKRFATVGYVKKVCAIYTYISWCIYIYIYTSHICLSIHPSVRPSVHPSIHPSLSLSLWSLYLIWFSIICPCHLQKEQWKTCRQDADRGRSGRRSTPFWTPGISGHRPRRPSPPRDFSCCARGFEPAAYGPGGVGKWPDKHHDDDMTMILMIQA